MWISFKYASGINDASLSFPYKAKSLTLGDQIMFENHDHIMEELERCYDEAVREKYPIGQSLYHQHFFFANTQDVICSKSQSMIKEYLYSVASSTPPFRSIQETPASYIDQYMIIKEEIDQYNLLNAKGNKK